MIDMATPEALAAQHFMERKGLGHLEPFDVEKLDDQPCWYFYYDLPEGQLELEVFWDPRDGWETTVTTFSRHVS
jgi:hypothetical protein